MLSFRALLAWIGRRLGILLFDKERESELQLPARHILVIRWDDKLGDSIVSSFFYREIKKIGGIKISVVTTEALALLHKHDFGVDNVIVSGKQPGYYELSRISRELSDVDTIIHPVGRIKIEDVFFISRIKPKNVFSMDDELNWVNIKMGIATQRLRFNQKYSYILNRLGVSNIDDRYIIPIRPSSQDGTNVASKYDILFNPFGSTNVKSINVKRTQQILLLISTQKTELSIGILSSPKTRDTARLMVDSLARENVKLIDGVHTIYDVMEAVSSSSLIISVDTSIVHIAAGLGKRLVAIYPLRTGEGGEFNPWLPKESDQTRIIYSLQVPGQKQSKDMNNFEDEDIVESIDALLKHDFGFRRDSNTRCALNDTN